jgi:hypothetical protein
MAFDFHQVYVLAIVSLAVESLNERRDGLEQIGLGGVCVAEGTPTVQELKQGGL